MDSLIYDAFDTSRGFDKMLAKGIIFQSHGAGYDIKTGGPTS